MFNSSFSEVLLEAKMPVVDFETCAVGNADMYSPVDNETMVCAGFGGNSVVSGCHGDSGGPFVCKESGRWVARGAVSWGDHLCRAGSTFSVFARISTFVDWIHVNKRKPQCVRGKTVLKGISFKYLFLMCFFFREGACICLKKVLMTIILTYTSSWDAQCKWPMFSSLRAFHELLEISQKVPLNFTKRCLKFAQNKVKSCFL